MNIMNKNEAAEFFVPQVWAYKILPKNLMTCKPAFYTFYTSHLR